MKDIENEIITVEEANRRLDRTFEADFWEFLVRRLNYKECRFDRDTQSIILPSYVPFEELFTEVLKEADERQTDYTRCERCREYFDAGSDPGIFSVPRKLEGFICEMCARKLSAWDFFNDHLDQG